VTSLVRSAVGPIRENSEARSLLGETMLEVVNVVGPRASTWTTFAETQLPQ
jgi:hypothetical protein